MVDDFVCLADLAPTFVEAGKVEVPEECHKSLGKFLFQKKGKWIQTETPW